MRAPEPLPLGGPTGAERFAHACMPRGAGASGVRRRRVAARVTSGRLRWLQLLYRRCLNGNLMTHASAVHLQLAGLVPRRTSVSAMAAEAIIRNRLTAFNTGVAPSRMRPYIMIVSGESEPTSISVVLKFSNDMRKAMAAAPISAGRR